LEKEVTYVKFKTAIFQIYIYFYFPSSAITKALGIAERGETPEVAAEPAV
jgi:hypothetical protein